MFIIIILNELIKYFNNFPILISNTINVNSDIHIYRSSSGSLIIFKSKNQPQSKNLKNQWSRGFPGDSVVKNPPANAGDACSVPGLGRCNMLPALEQLSPVLQLLSLCSRAREPQLLKAARPSGQAPHQEKLPWWEACAPQPEISPCLLQLEKSPGSNKGPVQPKIIS